MPAEEKNEISHRGKSLAQVKEFLATECSRLTSEFNAEQ